MSENDNSRGFGLSDFLIAGISIGLGKLLSKFLRSLYFKDSLFWNEFGWIGTFICIFLIWAMLRTIYEYLKKGSN